eukprot:g2555.t1
MFAQQHNYTSPFSLIFGALLASFSTIFVIVSGYALRLLIVRGLILPASMGAFFKNRLIYRNLDVDVLQQKMQKDGFWELFHIPTSDGIQIHVAQHLCKIESDRWVIMFLGNGGMFELHGQDGSCFSNTWNCNVLLMNYRGVNKSSGIPIYEDDLIKDGLACLKHIVVSEGAKLENILLYGHSLGGAVAALVRDRVQNNPPDWIPASQSAQTCPMVIDRSFISLDAVPSAVFFVSSPDDIEFLQWVKPKGRAVLRWIMENLKWTLDIGKVWRDSQGKLGKHTVILFHTKDDIIDFRNASMFSGLRCELEGAEQMNQGQGVDMYNAAATIAGGGIATAAERLGRNSPPLWKNESLQQDTQLPPIAGPGEAQSIRLSKEKAMSPHNMPLINDPQWPVVACTVNTLFASSYKKRSSNY